MSIQRRFTVFAKGTSWSLISKRPPVKFGKNVQQSFYTHTSIVLRICYSPSLFGMHIVKVPSENMANSSGFSIRLNLGALQQNRYEKNYYKYTVGLYITLVCNHRK